MPRSKRTSDCERRNGQEGMAKVSEGASGFSMSSRKGGSGRLTQGTGAHQAHHRRQA